LLKVSEVVRVAIGPVPIVLHPIGLDLILGAVAQLGERLICIQEVAGSIPTSSTSCGKMVFQSRDREGVG
jgi:hypothetical protein